MEDWKQKLGQIRLDGGSGSRADSSGRKQEQNAKPRHVDGKERQNGKPRHSDGDQWQNGRTNYVDGSQRQNGRTHQAGNVQDQGSRSLSGERSQKYIGAPYNFIPFYNKVYQYPEGKLTAHNSMEESLATGEITYEVRAETPLMIDDGTQHFFRDAKGRYAIPGSTMRGLIRNNVQVLGLCSYEDDIDDYALMYRNVAYGAERVQYNNTLGAKQIPIPDGTKNHNLSVLLNVRAGYVSNVGGEYVIFQTAVDSLGKNYKAMNYYVLSERRIVDDYLKYNDKFSYGFFRQNGRTILQREFQELRRSEKNDKTHYMGETNKAYKPYYELASYKDKFSYGFFRQNGRSILQHEFQKFCRSEKNGRTHYIGEANKVYRPYYEPVSYEVVNGKDITAVGYPGEYKNEGYAVSTGKMNEKKAVYIIPQIDKSKDIIKIPEEDVRAFRIDLKKKENTLKQFGGKKYFDLPEEGETRPVFYIRLDGRLYFGFTPRLRLFYDHKVKEGLKQEWKSGGVDYARALFGYVSPEKSYKSKLSFSDAVLQADVGHGAEQQLILAEPKPTSYLDYLKQKGNAVTYNSDGFELRGVKQYWLHNSLVQADPVKNEKASSTICPLKEGAVFKGKIRFQNLTEDELGLLLWAVRLNEGAQMNIGKAKAYGYGRISVEIKEARRLDLQRAYKSEETLCMDPFCEIEVDQTIEDYKAEINRHLGGKTVDELPHIRDFFLMKDSGRIPDNGQTRYMKIEAKEYQSRKDPLPEVQSIVKPK